MRRGRGGSSPSAAIYTAPTVEAAEAHFENFADTWRDLYPAMISSWESMWGEFVPFLAYPSSCATSRTPPTPSSRSAPGSGGRCDIEAFSQRAVGAEAALSRGHAAPAEP